MTIEKKGRIDMMKKSFIEEKMKTLEEREQEEKKAKLKMRKETQKRFGYDVNYEKYRTSNLIRIVCAVIAIIIIPL